jgi:hypothetical protein
MRSPRPPSPAGHRRRRRRQGGPPARRAHPPLRRLLCPRDEHPRDRWWVARGFGWVECIRSSLDITRQRGRCKQQIRTRQSRSCQPAYLLTSAPNHNHRGRCERQAAHRLGPHHQDARCQRRPHRQARARQGEGATCRAPGGVVQPACEQIRPGALVYVARRLNVPCRFPAGTAFTPQPRLRPPLPPPQGIITQVTDVKPLASVITYTDEESGGELYQEVLGR